MRTKTRSNRGRSSRPPLELYESGSSSDSVDHIEIRAGTMVKKSKKSYEESPLSTLNVLELPPRESLLRDDGSWADCDKYFVRRDPAIDNEVFFQDIFGVYEENPGSSRNYDRGEMDLYFGRLPGTFYECAPVNYERFTGRTKGDFIRCVRATFHLGDEIKIRWPTPEERIYHRFPNGGVAIPLEHLRSGFHPKCHIFVKE